ncbi:hypothetical protein A2U01_0117909, partial [Trifolium medium]|nr:hypothetical protein [Trifolium medium]
TPPQDSPVPSHPPVTPPAIVKILDHLLPLVSGH